MKWIINSAATNIEFKNIMQRWVRVCSIVVLFSLAWGIVFPVSSRGEDDEELIDSLEPVGKKRRSKADKPKAKPKPKPAKKKVVRVEEEAAPEPAKAQESEAARALAFRNVGVAEFEGKPGLPADFPGRLAESLRAELKRQAILTPIEIPRAYGLKIAKARLAQECQDASAEALLVGEITTKEISVAMMSINGRRILSTKLTLKSGDDDAKVVAQKLAEALVRQIPYRGYITNIEGDIALLNVGSRQKLNPGDRLNVIEYEGFNEGLSAPRSQTGQIEILEVMGPDSARGRIVSGGRDVRLFQKIEYQQAVAKDTPVDKPAPRNDPPEPSTPSNWQLGLGIHYFTAGPEGSASGSSDLAYRVPPSYLYHLSLRSSRGTDISFAMGTSPNINYTAVDATTYVATAKLAIMELRGTYDIWSSQRSQTRWSVGTGLRVANYKLTKDISGTPPAEFKIPSDSTVYGPVLRFRGLNKWGTKVDIFGGLEVYFPMLSTLSSAFFSYGSGFEFGARYNFNRSWALELGGFIRYYRRAVEAQNSVFERDLQYYTHAVMAF